MIHEKEFQFWNKLIKEEFDMDYHSIVHIIEPDEQLDYYTIVGYVEKTSMVIRVEIPIYDKYKNSIMVN